MVRTGNSYRKVIDYKLSRYACYLIVQKANQMAMLFDRNVKTIRKHINNALSEELNDEVVVAKFASTTKYGAIDGKTYQRIY